MPTTPILSFKAEKGVGAIATSPSGRDVALASRSGLYIVDLTEPYSPPRYLSFKTPWEVSSIQWCSHPNHYNRVVSTASQKLVVWNLALPSHAAAEHVLHGHSRAITDVSFSKLSPDLLATCSIDTYVHIWDMRDPVRPSMSFADFEAGASQVKWSRTQPHLLASAHQNRLILWDSRKSSVPLNQTVAHSRRINSIDFDDSANSNLATASIDRSIKVWNLHDFKTGGEQTPRLVMRTTFPVWRTRYLPEGGNGAFVIPLRGSNNNAHLVDLSPKPDTAMFEPVQTFTRHKAPIKDLSIRREGNGYNLLTWGGDSTMCMWNVDESSLNAVNVPTTLHPIPPRDYTYRVNPAISNFRHKHRTGFFKMENNVSQDENHIGWIAGVQMGGANSPSEENAAPFFSGDGDPLNTNDTTPAVNLSREVTAVSNKFPKLHFEQIDIASGHLVLTSRGPWGRDEEEFVVLRVHIDFPTDYPYSPLKCIIEDDPNCDATKVAELDQSLTESTSSLADHGKPALEFVLRQIMGEKPHIETFILEPNYSMDVGDDIDDLYNSSTDSEYGVQNPVIQSDSEEEAEDVDRKPDNQFIGGTQPKLKFDSTPLPRTCGACWSNNGMLIVFQSKEKELPMETNLYSLDRVLAGDGESDSESSSMGSFESENFEQEQANNLLPRRFNLNFKAWNAGSTKETSHPDESDSLKAMAIWKILNFNSILPCRADMAAEYRFDFTLENFDELVLYNSKVAEKYGRHEDAYIWRLSNYPHVRQECLSPDTLQSINGNRNLLPFFNMSSSKFNSSTFASLAEYLSRTQNYQLLVGIDCMISVLSADKTKKLTETFYYSKDGRPVSFINYFESLYEFKHPNMAQPLLTHSGRSRRHREKAPVVIHKYSLNAINHSNFVRPPPISRTRSSADNRDHHSSNIHLFPSQTNSSQPSEVSSINDNDSLGGLTIKVQYLNPTLSDDDGLLYDGSEGGNGQVERERERERQNSHYGLYSSERHEQMAERRQIYASMLDTWGLYLKRLEILNTPLPSSEFETLSDDGEGDDFSVSVKLAGKRHGDGALTCVYCLRSLTTQFVSCLRCNHVYHRKCMETWSEVSDSCASGCGCECMQSK